MSKQNKLIKTIQSYGYIFPTDEESVLEFEKIHEKDIKSIKPKEWENPLNILTNGYINKTDILKETNSSAENLAQAAREGKQLSAEIKKRMLDDRTKKDK